MVKNNSHCGYPKAINYPENNEFKEKIEELRCKILNFSDPTLCTKKVWYVSNKGSKSNIGNSPCNAWDSIDTLMQNFEKISRGDAVLFERGGVYRGFFTAKSGVYYGAYGEGSKPMIYGSFKNYAAEKWINPANNIWSLDIPFETDVGNIIFNFGECVGFKKKLLKELCNNYDFFCDHQDSNKIYLYLDFAPYEFSDIEIATDGSIVNILENSNDITVENLSLKYTGAHGIRVANNSKNIVIKNCEISYIGGAYLSGYGDGTTRYGNGIEFWRGCDNVLVENNWIYQIYDSGISHQGDGKYIARNIIFNENLIERCGMGSIEYWLSHSKDDYNYAENVTYSNNLLRFVGYGWSWIQRPDKHMVAHIQSNGPNQNHINNFKIFDNVFELSRYNLLAISSIDNIFPLLSGNTYIQNLGGRLGTFAQSRDVIFDSEVQEIISWEWGDKTGKIIFA